MIFYKTLLPIKYHLMLINIILSIYYECKLCLGTYAYCLCYHTYVYRNIVYQRESHECKMMRQKKRKSDFTKFIDFLKSVIKRVKRVIINNNSFIILLSVFIIMYIFCIRWIQILILFNLLICTITESFFFIRQLLNILTMIYHSG